MESSQGHLWLAEVWMQHRERLLRLLSLRMPPGLQRRMSPEDLLQETYLACGQRLAWLQEEGECPLYVRLRRIALQVLVNQERRHLAAGKRDAMKEVVLEDPDQTMEIWANFADSISSPRSHMIKLERVAIARQVLDTLPEADREILILRHFEELSNQECAAVLGVSPKAASIRYVRALKRFQDQVSLSSLF